MVEHVSAFSWSWVQALAPNIKREVNYISHSYLIFYKNSEIFQLIFKFLDCKSGLGGVIVSELEKT